VPMWAGAVTDEVAEQVAAKQVAARQVAPGQAAPEQADPGGQARQ